ncbi:PEP/pyruvate-binding domain-containing protein [uncultured Marivirga sp.]|uniref:PEP/pyruvate-binding domain-containing protein n=1 Tax=uncultured Marivirga sp. TaxID=1123707 RepID=UPI0030EBF602|tara:strand:+ start:113396 stop:115768 length:2373 start_codon:yes stop_codon:yes gene_type:complete
MKKLKGTKAETLIELLNEGFPVPAVYFFTVKSWKTEQDVILNEIKEKFEGVTLLAVRSSAMAEDSVSDSMAGAFHSELNVDISSSESLIKNITEVIYSFDENIDNQVLVQPMVEGVVMSGVVMTKSLKDGSPYYVINYDDVTGKTDTVTSGNSINKTVYLYNGVKESDFDSNQLLEVLRLVRSLEDYFDNIPLDIEFAVDGDNHVHLLQVRQITTSGKWNHSANQLVSERISFLREYIDSLMRPRSGLFGFKTLFGIMPDWNPAEMIGVIPHPMALSLYRTLITNDVWRIARTKMGYRDLPPIELMVSLYGRAYIDVRNSLNSFLPAKLEGEIAKKLTDAYLVRLENDPHLHDKIEFEVVFTAYDFTFSETFENRYPKLLSEKEFTHYQDSLKELTVDAIRPSANNSLDIALNDIEYLKSLQLFEHQMFNEPLEVVDRINTLVEECKTYGTIPFSITARHGFITEVLLRSAIKKGVITKERVSEFRKSIRTIAGEMSSDFYKVCKSQLPKTEFLQKYGHLRPSSYDILSPSYRDRSNLFEGNPEKPVADHHFELSPEEKLGFENLLTEHKFKDISVDALFQYFAKAVAGREYAKFIFTRHLSEILELIKKWGKLIGFDLDDLSMLTLHDIQESSFSPLNSEKKSFFRQKVIKARENYAVATSFKLNYLIRSSRDVNVVPMQRNQANFVGNKVVDGGIIFLNPYDEQIPNLKNKIICIEGADPGYDWIFSREISGLITKYGGVNSHMAIRCAELGIPAAIGCGEQPFERIIKAGACILDTEKEKLVPFAAK